MAEATLEDRVKEALRLLKIASEVMNHGNPAWSYVINAMSILEGPHTGANMWSRAAKAFRERWG